MKRILFLLPLMIALMCTVVSCEESNNTAYPPTWKGFQLSPDRNSIYAGGEVTVTACQDEKGHLINATSYTWTLSLDTLNTDGSASGAYELSKTVKTNYDGTDNGDPSYTFRIPANAVPNGRATISFAASYSYSADGIEVSNGTTYDQSTNYAGSIYSQSATLYGKANGSISFYVKKR